MGEIAVDHRICDEFLEITESIRNCRDKAADLLNDVKSLVEINDGHPLLDVRNHVLLQHLINLLRFQKAKVQGEPVDGSEIITRLIKTKTILQHTRKLEEKLRPNITRLFTLGVQKRKAESEVVSEDLMSLAVNDPLVFKPNIDDLIAGDDKTGIVDGNNSINEGENEVYKPPKVFGTMYNEPNSKIRSRIEKYKRKTRESRIISEFENEVYGLPEHISSVGTGYAVTEKSLNKDIEAIKEREEYEIEHLVRLPLDREDKRRRRRISRSSGVFSINDELSAINEDFKDVRRLRYAYNASSHLQNSINPGKRNSNRKEDQYDTSFDLKKVSSEIKESFESKKRDMEKRIKRINKKRKLNKSDE